MNAWAPPRFLVVKEATCAECQGFGMVPLDGGRVERCRRCGGKGRVREEVSLVEALHEIGLTSLLREMDLALQDQG